MGTVNEEDVRLSDLLRRVRGGESILILSRGRPVARIEPVRPDEEDGEVRLARLEARGLIRRGRGIDLDRLADPQDASLLRALLEDREEGR